MASHAAKRRRIGARCMGPIFILRTRPPPNQASVRPYTPQRPKPRGSSAARQVRTPIVQSVRGGLAGKSRRDVPSFLAERDRNDTSRPDVIGPGGQRGTDLCPLRVGHPEVETHRCIPTSVGFALSRRSTSGGGRRLIQRATRTKIVAAATAETTPAGHPPCHFCPCIESGSAMKKPVAVNAIIPAPTANSRAGRTGPTRLIILSSDICASRNASTEPPFPSSSRRRKISRRRLPKSLVIGTTRIPKQISALSKA